MLIRLKPANPLVSVEPADAPAHFTKTDSQGCFHIFAERGTWYILQAYSPGFTLGDQIAVVKAGQVRTYNFELEPAHPCFPGQCGAPPVSIDVYTASPPRLNTVCFVDSDGLPVDAVDFTLEGRDTSQKTFTGSKPPAYIDDYTEHFGEPSSFLKDDHPKNWGCWFVAAPYGKYVLRAIAPSYQPLQQDLNIQSDSISIKLVPAQP